MVGLLTVPLSFGRDRSTRGTIYRPVYSESGTPNASRIVAGRELIADVEPLVFKSSAQPLWSLLPAFIGIALLLAPKGFPGPEEGCWLCCFSQRRNSSPRYRFTLLDVGQGLAAVVQTEHHTLRYDVGPRYSVAFNVGDFAVLPF